MPEEIQPTIWRQLVVDGRVSLGRLHHFIQAAMGWHDAHLHEFVIDGTRYAIPHPDPTMVDPEQLDARRVTLNRLLATGSATSTTSATAGNTASRWKRSFPSTTSRPIRSG